MPYTYLRIIWLEQHTTHEEAQNQSWGRVHLGKDMAHNNYAALSILPEVIPMTTTISNKTVKVLRLLFGRYGSPQAIVTDNDSQLTSSIFLQKTAASRDLLHATPVLMEKQSTCAMKTGTGDVQTKLCQLLMHHQALSLAGTNKTPAELMFWQEYPNQIRFTSPPAKDKADTKKLKEIKSHHLVILFGLEIIIRM